MDNTMRHGTHACCVCAPTGSGHLSAFGVPSDTTQSLSQLTLLRVSLHNAAAHIHMLAVLLSPPLRPCKGCGHSLCHMHFVV
jgi:hypothetical protein